MRYSKADGGYFSRETEQSPCPFFHQSQKTKRKRVRARNFNFVLTKFQHGKNYIITDKMFVFRKALESERNQPRVSGKRGQPSKALGLTYNELQSKALEREKAWGPIGQMSSPYSLVEQHHAVRRIPAPIPFCFAYFRHAFPVNKYPRNSPART